MNYSYLMGVDDVSELQKYGFFIDEMDDDYGIVFPKGKEKVYEDFIQKNLSPGYWNEYLGKEYVFLFKFEDGTIKKYIYNKVNEKKILELCCQFADCTFSSVENMLQDNEFYATKYFKDK